MNLQMQQSFERLAHLWITLQPVQVVHSIHTTKWTYNSPRGAIFVRLQPMRKAMMLIRAFFAGECNVLEVDKHIGGIAKHANASNCQNKVDSL